MKMRLFIIVFFALSLAVLLLSCTNDGIPTGYIGGKDVDPPSIDIIAPEGVTVIKDTLILKIRIADINQINSINFSLTPSDSPLGVEYMGHSGNIFTYKLNVAYLKGEYTISVTSSDAENNVATARIKLNFSPIIRTVYKNSSTNSTSLSAIIEDKTGRIWMGSNRGLFCYVNNYLITSPSGFNLPAPSISALAVDSKNTIWMIYKQKYDSEPEKLVAYNGSSVVGNYYLKGVNGTTNDYAYSCLQFDSNDSLQGICSYWGWSGCFAYKDEKWNLKTSTSARGLKIDKLNRIWTFTSSKVIYQESGISYDAHYPGSYCQQLITDNQNNVWAFDSYYGRSNKVMKYSAGTWTSYDVLSDGNELKGFAVDSNGRVWLSGGGFLWKYDSNMKLLRKFPMLVSSLFADNKGNLWYLDEWGIYYLNEN